VPKVANDVLFRASAVPDILHQLAAGVAVDGLLAHEHAANSTAQYACASKNTGIPRKLFSTTHFSPPNPTLYNSTTCAPAFSSRSEICLGRVSR
jgi:hypothetical protein